MTCVGASRGEVYEVAREYWDLGVRHIVGPVGVRMTWWFRGLATVAAVLVIGLTLLTALLVGRGPSRRGLAEVPVHAHR